jgi:serine protease AprX
VLNLSLGAAPQSRYWEDPLNRAVMRAWQAGLVVVASAGNTGPGPQTITVPGNVPYVITVGAMTDNYTPANSADDRLASFSAAGPTYEGFVKPDVVAPGGHIWSLMPTYATIAQGHPAYQNSGDYFTMSGTSQAAAVTTGVVALLLQAQPGLTPDQVKCKLLSSARPAVDAKGAFAYSVFQQGAGLIDAAAARDSERLDCANRGLDVDADLAGTQHFGGGARQDAQGQYYLADANGYGWYQGYTWNQGYAWNQGYTWNQGYAWNQSASQNQGYAWNQGYTWSQGYVWNQSSCDWNDGDPWAQGSAPGTASSMSINAWVAQE